MFDNLRDSSYYDEEQNEPYTEPEVVKTKPAPAKRRKRNRRFLGMTAEQRFLLAFMVMIMVCVMGLLAMLVTDRMFLF